MSRTQASGSPHCAEARQKVSGGRCAIIFRAAGERHESRIYFFDTQNTQGQYESGMSAGFDEAVSFKAGFCKKLWKPERAALLAVSED